MLTNDLQWCQATFRFKHSCGGSKNEVVQCLLVQQTEEEGRRTDLALVPKFSFLSYAVIRVIIWLKHLYLKPWQNSFFWVTAYFKNTCRHILALNWLTAGIIIIILSSTLVEKNRKNRKQNIKKLVRSQFKICMRLAIKTVWNPVKKKVLTTKNWWCVHVSSKKKVIQCSYKDSAKGWTVCN